MNSKRARGRPAFSPTGEQRVLVTALRANGIDPEQIARELSITKPTLYKHFRDEMDYGFDRIVARMKNTVLRKALAGDNACLFFWLKTQAGVREVQSLEHSGPGGAPLQMPNLVINFVDPPADDAGDALEPG